MYIKEKHNTIGHLLCFNKLTARPVRQGLIPCAPFTRNASNKVFQTQIHGKIFKVRCFSNVKTFYSVTKLLNSADRL